MNCGYTTNLLFLFHLSFWLKEESCDKFQIYVAFDVFLCSSSCFKVSTLAFEFCL